MANLSVLGYDPRDVFQGRGVLEAASMGSTWAPEDVAMRCNLICIDDDGKIKNHSAGHISTEEAHAADRDPGPGAGRRPGDRPVTFHPGVSYRHLLVLPGGWARPEFNCAPPHDHVGEARGRPDAHGAVNDGAVETVDRLIEVSSKGRAQILADHPVNRARLRQG